MKKFLAVLFSMIILAVFMAVPAFAAGSPEGEIIFTVEMPDGEKISVTEGETVTLEVSDTEKEFEGWKITGEYDIVSGTLTSAKLVITPKSDLTVEETYADTIIQEDKNENESDKAPQTGNGVLMVTVLLTAAAFVGMVATKKAVKA